MGMRIRTNVESLTAQRFMGQNNEGMSQSLERLSSGYRINKSADDAAGFAISENLRAKTRGLNQAKRNANDGISLVQVAEGSLTEVNNILVRLRELSVQAASDTLGDKEKNFLQKEYVQLVDEIDRIAQTTEFNGLALMSDEAASSDISVQVGYNGEAQDTIKLKLSDSDEGLSSESLRIRDTQLAGETRDVIAGNLGVIDDALTRVASQRASLGASQSRLTSAINNLSINTESLQAANSRIRDVDFAEETAKLTQSRILSQASLAVLSQANQRPEMALNLLR
jgi:flagellin